MFALPRRLQRLTPLLLLLPTCQGFVISSVRFPQTTGRPHSLPHLRASIHGEWDVNANTAHNVAMLDKTFNATDLLAFEPVTPTGTTDQFAIVAPGDQPQSSNWWGRLLDTYWGPRLVLVVLAACYATNFPLGSILNEHLPPSAATTGRMVLAATVLSPAISQLKPFLRLPALLCGCCTAAGYVTQSIALLDTGDPARVSFLGSATVLWCPVLQCWIDRQPMGWRDAPQTWLAALLCVAGVGILECSGGGDGSMTSAALSTGDAWALAQAVGFGTSLYGTSRMLAREPDQALPVTATLIATTAFWSLIWSLSDGWMWGHEDWRTTMALPGLLGNPDMAPVAAALLWTGLVSTSLTNWIELMALGRVDPSEASVILASEPLWAAVLAATFLGNSLSSSDAMGGALIVAACLVHALVTPETLFGQASQKESHP